MYVLGIETSCDETSVSVVKDGRSILSNEISSSLAFHSRYGGIIPEIASRMQLETIASVAESAIKKAGIRLLDISLISVTHAPGLPGSLLVGNAFANALSLSLGVGLIAPNHLHSHIYAAFLDHPGLRLPAVALVVSGGHTNLFHLSRFDKIECMGQTHDDACGEAFDKVAKILGLGYPGGPQIEKRALKGNPKKIVFKCSTTPGPFDFSFSGIKTAVLYYTQKHAPCSHQLTCDIAASFQEAVFEKIVNKSLAACRKKKCTRLIIGGGVAANNCLREKFFRAAQSDHIKTFFPTTALCMDNAAMVGGIGYQLWRLRKTGKAVPTKHGN